MKNEILKDLHKLDDFIYARDIPSPTIPEYVELHEKITQIREELSRIIQKYDTN